jgi:hypothetical protein
MPCVASSPHLFLTFSRVHFAGRWDGHVCKARGQSIALIYPKQYLFSLTRWTIVISPFFGHLHVFGVIALKGFNP